MNKALFNIKYITPSVLCLKGQGCVDKFSLKLKYMLFYDLIYCIAIKNYILQSQIIYLVAIGFCLHCGNSIVQAVRA